MEGIEFDGPKGKISIRPEDHVAIQDMYILKLVDLAAPDFAMFELGDHHPPRAALPAARGAERPLRRPAHRQSERTVVSVDW